MQFWSSENLKLQSQSCSNTPDLTNQLISSPSWAEVGDRAGKTWAGHGIIGPGVESCLLIPGSWRTPCPANVSVFPALTPTQLRELKSLDRSGKIIHVFTNRITGCLPTPYTTVTFIYTSYTSKYVYRMKLNKSVNDSTLFNNLKRRYNG